MIIGTCKVYMSASWVYSLKEKRMVVKSIIEKTKNRFNVSIAEIEEQDTHRTIVLGFACVTNTRRHADSVTQNVLAFIEGCTDAVVDRVEIEII